MESTTPGLIAQLKGIPTTQRYKYVTVFVDHFTRYTFIHLQQTITSEETLQAKQEFEAFAQKLGVTILNYHADNGRFADKAFVMDTRQKLQGLTYCGVHAHFQNGIAERRIRDLQE